MAPSLQQDFFRPYPTVSDMRWLRNLYYRSAKVEGVFESKGDKMKRIFSLMYLL